MHLFMGLPVTFLIDNEFYWNTPIGKYRILGSCFYFKLFCNESDLKCTWNMYIILMYIHLLTLKFTLVFMFMFF